MAILSPNVRQIRTTARLWRVFESRSGGAGLGGLGVAHTTADPVSGSRKSLRWPFFWTLKYDLCKLGKRAAFDLSCLLIPEGGGLGSGNQHQSHVPALQARDVGSRGV